MARKKVSNKDFLPTPNSASAFVLFVAMHIVLFILIWFVDSEMFFERVVMQLSLLIVLVYLISTLVVSRDRFDAISITLAIITVLSILSYFTLLGWLI
jgi:hypothetical protein